MNCEFCGHVPSAAGLHRSPPRKNSRPSPTLVGPDDAAVFRSPYAEGASAYANMKSLLTAFFAFLALCVFSSSALAVHRHHPTGDNTYKSDTKTAALGNNKIKVDVTGATANTFKVFVNGVAVQNGPVDPNAGSFTISLDVPLKANDQVQVKGTSPSTSGPFTASITVSTQ